MNKQLTWKQREAWFYILISALICCEWFTFGHIYTLRTSFLNIKKKKKAKSGSDFETQLDFAST